MIRVAAWLVGVAAAIATAHGIYQVAVAARAGEWVAWTYPVMTDGLALVAYRSTRRLTGAGGRYAWCVVVLAALVSGVAQAAHLASGATTSSVPWWLAALIGGWPAIAAAVTAHLLYLLHRAEQPAHEREHTAGDATPGGVLDRPAVSLIKAPRTAPVRPPVPVCTDPVPDVLPDRTAPDEVLVADLRAEQVRRGKPLPVAEIRSRYGIGTDRARAVRTAAETSSPALNGATR